MIRRHTHALTVYARNDNELGDEKYAACESRIRNMFWLVQTLSGKQTHEQNKKDTTKIGRRERKLSKI